MAKVFNPFPGLRPFEQDEDSLFFGRDGQSDELLQRLRRNRFVAVVGTSGSGKSSLVRAGLLPTLHGGFMANTDSSWRVALARPGSNPIGNLAAALTTSAAPDARPPGQAATQQEIVETTLRRGALGLIDAVRQARMPADESLLIVIDQFEEIFRFKHDNRSERADEDAAAFVKLLLEATRQNEVAIYVVLTMRSDYLGDCAQFRDLPEAINDSEYLIPRMTRDERKEAIVRPIAVGGARIAPRLVNRLLNDVGDNPDQLPILQHALMRTWNYWTQDHTDSEPIDLRHYEAIGGMENALSQHADRAYEQLTDSGKAIAEKLFRCLTEKVGDNRETRRPTTLKEICAILEANEEEVIPVIEAFRREGRSFLTPPPPAPLGPETLIDISHESLIRNWKRLKDWVDREALSAATYRRVAERAVLYGQAAAELLRGRELDMALAWHDAAKPNKDWGKRYHEEFDRGMAFLRTSGTAREVEAQEKESRRRRELRRTRLFALILGTAFLIAAVFGLLAFIQKQKVERQTRVTEAALDEANHQKERAEAALDEANRQKERAEDALDEANRLKEKARREQEKAVSALGVAKRERERAMQAESSALEQKQIAQLEALRVRKQSLNNDSTIVMLTNALIAKSSPQEAVIWRLYKANALSEMGNHEDAIVQATLILKESPDNLRARFERGYNYLTVGQAEDALKDIDAYLALDSKFWAAYQNKALALGLLGRYPDAAQAVTKGLDSFIHSRTEFSENEISPDIQMATRRKVLMVSELTARLALNYEQATLKACAGDSAFEQALDAADHKAKAIGKGKDLEAKEGYLFALNWAWIHSENRRSDYGALASQAALWQRAGFKDWAWKYYTRFQERHAANADGRYNGLARWVQEQKDRLRRTTAPRDANLLEKTHAPSADLLAFQAEEQWSGARLSSQERAIQRVDVKVAQKLENALQLITSALKSEPDNVEFRILRALINQDRKDYLKVREDCNIMLQLAPRTAIAYHLRALANMGLGIGGQVVEGDQRNAVEYDPSDTEASLDLAGSVISADVKKASELIDQSFRSNTSTENLSTLYSGRMAVQSRNGNNQAALESIETAIRMNENNLDLYDNRAEIERKLKLTELQIARHQAAGYSRAGDIRQSMGQSIDALDVYRQSLRLLANLDTKDRTADVRMDVAHIISKISEILIDSGSTEKTADFWRLALEAGYLKVYEEIVNNEIVRLTKSVRSAKP